MQAHTRAHTHTVILAIETSWWAQFTVQACAHTCIHTHMPCACSWKQPCTMDLKYAQIRSQLLRVTHYNLVCSALYSKIHIFACVFMRILEPCLVRTFFSAHSMCIYMHVSVCMLAQFTGEHCLLVGGKSSYFLWFCVKLPISYICTHNWSCSPGVSKWVLGSLYK